MSSSTTPAPLRVRGHRRRPRRRRPRSGPAGRRATRSSPPPASPTPPGGASTPCSPAPRSASRPPSRGPATCCCSPSPTTCFPTWSRCWLRAEHCARASTSPTPRAATASRSSPRPTALGVRPMALHPAMTFTGTAVDLPRLDGCVFGVTAGDAEREVAAQLVADLGGRPMWVPEERRSLYHAGLAHGANHLVTLVSEAMELLSASGADDPAATLRPLLQAALDNALEQGDSALTGPIVRGDVETVRAHLAEVAANAPDTLPSYVALARGHARPGRHRRPGAPDPRREDPPRARRRRGAGRLPHPAMTPAPVVAATRHELADLLGDARRAGGRVALVPTMGALHEGHASLVRRARDEVGPAGRVVVSIFVNPMQFGPGEDLDRYPRTFDADLAVLCTRGRRPRLRAGRRRGLPGWRADGDGAPGPLAEVLEGAVRPGHFRGRAHGGRQAARPGPSRRRGLRGEGLPAAGADPADGRGPLPAGDDRGGADAAGARRPGAVLPQPLPRPRPADVRRPGCTGSCRRPGARSRKGSRPRWLPPAPRCAPPRGSTSTTSSSPTPTSASCPPTPLPGRRRGSWSRRGSAAPASSTTWPSPWASRPSSKETADAADDDEEQDPPGHGDPGRPPLRRLGDRRRRTCSTRPTCSPASWSTSSTSPTVPGWRPTPSPGSAARA